MYSQPIRSTNQSTVGPVFPPTSASTCRFGERCFSKKEKSSPLKAKRKPKSEIIRTSISYIKSIQDK